MHFVNSLIQLFLIARFLSNISLLMISKTLIFTMRYQFLTHYKPFCNTNCHNFPREQMHNSKLDCDSFFQIISFY